MIRTAIDDNLYQYQFAPEPGKAYGFNLYVLVDGQDALVIDTAYEEQATSVMEDLRGRGYAVKHVIISHFHPDHISGLKAFHEAVVWGSERYRLTMDDYPIEEQEKLPPVQTVTDSSGFRFGPFELAFRLAPGHSPCTICTTINNRYIHVADNLMASNDGEPILPWAEFEHLEKHIRSLVLLKELAPEVVLLAHGKPIEGKQNIDDEIEDRLRYLRAVKEGGGKVSVEEATAGCSRRFLCEHWHVQRE
jgi:glyoxylase-like metal-dependent hydrolase (beta-lactamase superfamily II)